MSNSPCLSIPITSQGSWLRCWFLPKTSQLDYSITDMNGKCHWMLQCIYMCTNSPVVNLIANVVLSLFSPELCKNLLNIQHQVKFFSMILILKSICIFQGCFCAKLITFKLKLMIISISPEMMWVDLKVVFTGMVMNSTNFPLCPFLAQTCKGVKTSELCKWIWIVEDEQS